MCRHVSPMLAKSRHFCFVNLLTIAAAAPLRPGCSATGAPGARSSQLKFEKGNELLIPTSRDHRTSSRFATSHASTQFQRHRPSHGLPLTRRRIRLANFSIADHSTSSRCRAFEHPSQIRPAHVCCARSSRPSDVIDKFNLVVSQNTGRSSRGLALGNRTVSR